MRTGALLDATVSLRDTLPPYRAPVDATALIEEFIASPSRVFLIKGPAGSGKTRLTYHLAEQTSGIDFQLHSSESWNAGHADVATKAAEGAIMHLSEVK